MTRILIGIIAALTVATLSLWLLNSRLSDHLTTVRSENRELRLSIERSTKTLNQYREDYERDAQSLSELDRKFKELERYVAALPDGAAQCLSPADTERLRQFWQ